MVTKMCTSQSNLLSTAFVQTKSSNQSFLISTISQDAATGQGKSISLVQLAGQVLAGCQVAAF